MDKGTNNFFHQKIVAEIGSVHDGSFGNALKLIDAAYRAGADVVKFQTHISEAETIKSAPNPNYFRSESRYEYFKRTAFTLDQWIKIKEKCDEIGVIFISSPFSIEAVDLLEKVGVAAYKIPSGELTNLPLLKVISEAGKPVLLSSGMSNWLEIDQAVEVLKPNCDLTVMQCSSIYPCPNNKVGLNIVKEIANRYSLPVGFSDHTLGFAASIAAAAYGAYVVEKHFTFSKKMYGSDAKNAMEPEDFKIFSDSVKSVWEIISNPVNKDDISEYKEMKMTFQKSIVASGDLTAGTIITEQNLAYKKPGTGLSPMVYKSILGKKLKKSKSKDEQILSGDLK